MDFLQQGLHGVDQPALHRHDHLALFLGQIAEFVQHDLLPIGGTDIMLHEAMDQFAQALQRARIHRHRMSDVGGQHLDMGSHHFMKHGFFRFIIMIEQRFRDAAGGGQFGDRGAVESYAGKEFSCFFHDGFAALFIVGRLSSRHIRNSHPKS